MPATSDHQDETTPAFAAARRMLRRRGGASFATFFLPRAKRDAAAAVSACLLMTRDAIASSAGGGGCCSGGAGGGEDVAAVVRARVEDVFAGRVELPLPQFRDETQWTLLAMAESARRFEIPRRPMLELVDAWSNDVNVSRYATWRSVEGHCRATGGNIAVLMTAILGATHSDAGHYAMQIGAAARWIEILCNLKADLARGRVYWPIEDLARCRCGEKDLLAGRVTNGMDELMRLGFARAREMLRAGAEGLCWLASDGSRMAAASFVAGQLATLDALQRRGAGILTGEPLRVPTSLRLRRLPDAWRLAKRQAAQPLPRLH
ncbi:MAG: squalene/phytoene synthase family protein [Tepidisphaeraceae bacterium]